MLLTRKVSWNAEVCHLSQKCVHLLISMTDLVTYSIGLPVLGSRMVPPLSGLSSLTSRLFLP